MTKRAMKPKASPLMTAIQKIPGIVFCIGCKDWRYPHECDGVPQNRMPWQFDTSVMVPADYKPKIEWLSELEREQYEAEEDNAAA